MRVFRTSLSFASLGLVCTISVANLGYAERVVTPTEHGDIVASDLEEMQDHAKSQYADVLEKLEVASSLSEQHKELVAIALSKDLEGLPLCSFNQEIEYKEETDKSETRYVTVHDNGLVSDDKGRERLFSEWKYSPFSAPPSAGMDFESGTLIEETETEATFQFRFDKKAKSSSESVTELIGNLKRVAKNLRYELTVDIQTGAPKALVLELIKPTRVMVVARVKKIRHEYVYEFDEELQRFIIPNQSVIYAYSAPGRGKVDEKINVVYSDFQCKKPIRYVWHTPADLQESSSSSFDD